MSPVTSAAAAFTARAFPSCGRLSRRTAGNRRTTSAVPSVEPSSTTTMSMSRYVCASSEVRHSAMCRSSLYAATMTLTRALRSPRIA